MGNINKITLSSFLVINVFALYACCANTNIKEAEKQVADSMQNVVIKDTKILMDYELIPLSKMIGIADLIVAGSVKYIRDSSFTFYIEEKLFGDIALQKLNVRMFFPSQFDEPRTVPYEMGQRFLLFLSKPVGENGSINYTILGYGGEGEMPIEGESLYFTAYNLEGLVPATAKVHGMERVLAQFNYTDFNDAVKNYGQCFAWTKVEEMKNNRKSERLVPSRKCSDTDIKTYQSKSWMHDYLVKETLSRIP